MLYFLKESDDRVIEEKRIGKADPGIHEGAMRAIIILVSRISLFEGRAHILILTKTRSTL